MNVNDITIKKRPNTMDLSNYWLKYNFQQWENKIPYEKLQKEKRRYDKTVAIQTIKNVIIFT